MLVAVNQHGHILSTGSKLWWRGEFATLITPERKGNRRSAGRLFVRWHDGVRKVEDASMFEVRVIDIGKPTCCTVGCERMADRILDRPVCLSCYAFQSRLAGACA